MVEKTDTKTDRQSDKNTDIHADAYTHVIYIYTERHTDIDTETRTGR